MWPQTLSQYSVSSGPVGTRYLIHGSHKQLDSDSAGRTRRCVWGALNEGWTWVAIKKLADRIGVGVGLPAGLLHGGHGLTLQIVGWKWRIDNPYEMPIIWHLINSIGTMEPRHKWRDRHATGDGRAGQARLDAIGDRRSKPLKDLRERFSRKNGAIPRLVERQLGRNRALGERCKRWRNR